MATKNKPKGIRAVDTDDGAQTSCGRHNVFTPKGKYMVSTAYAPDHDIYETIVFELESQRKIASTVYPTTNSRGLMIDECERDEISKKHQQLIADIKSGKIQISKNMFAS